MGKRTANVGMKEGPFIIVKRTDDGPEYFGADTRQRATEDAISLIEETSLSEWVEVDVFTKVSTFTRSVEIVEEEE